MKKRVIIEIVAYMYSRIIGKKETEKNDTLTDLFEAVF